MHDKLREFERASGLEIYGLGAKRIPWEYAMEKFAELIVRECAEFVENDNYRGVALAGRLKQHFGVEE